MNKKVSHALAIAVELEDDIKQLEVLVNGKQGFLKQLKKQSGDIGICRLNEDIFIAKTLSKRILDILRAIEAHVDMDEESDVDEEIEIAEKQYNKEIYNKSNSVY